MYRLKLAISLATAFLLAAMMNLNALEIKIIVMMTAMLHLLSWLVQDEAHYQLSCRLCIFHCETY